MCRNIKTLFNFEPPATEDEIEASALQFVRKLSGFNRPSQANEAAFDRAVAEVSDAARRLLVRKLSGFNRPSQANEAAFDRAVAEVSDAARRLLVSLHTTAPARDREVEAEKARERSRLRFG